jgi:peptide/nickel transport system ATP-binding protein
MTSLNPCFAIGNQLEETMLRHRSVSRREARERAVHLLERTGIGNAGQRMHQFPHQLSGGLRQRVMIAMALMCSPTLLIADEPTTALDVTVQVQILSLLKQLAREFSMGLLLITHDLGVVAHMADRVAVMYAGRIVEAGDVVSVIREPRHPYTRGLLSCLPKRGNRGKRLGVIPGSAFTAPGDEGCPFRTRCEFAAPICGTGPIPVFETPPDHHYACRLEPRS